MTGTQGPILEEGFIWFDLATMMRREYNQEGGAIMAGQIDSSKGVRRVGNPG